MKKDKFIRKIFGIALSFVLVVIMFGGPIHIAADEVAKLSELSNVLSASTGALLYNGSVLPQDADPPWVAFGGGFESTDGNILTVNTIGMGCEEKQYNMNDIVDSTKGIIVEARVRIGVTSDEGTIPDTAIAISNSEQAFKLVFLEDRIAEGMDSISWEDLDNHYLMDTVSDFHVYRITVKDSIAKVYVDGIDRLTLAGFPHSSNCVTFGEVRADCGGMNGLSYWDYVKISTGLAYVPDDYSTIQAAVDAANFGDTIIVRDDTYTENVNVNTDHLTIRSQNGAEVTIVQAANPDDHVFDVTAHYVNITGFTVIGASGKSGVYLDNTHDCEISGNNISNNYNGVCLYSASNNGIVDNSLSNNIGESGTNAPRGGLYLYGSYGNRICDNDSSHNQDGIVLKGSSSENYIKNNSFDSNDYWGIILEHSHNNRIEGNTMSENGSGGVRLIDSDNNNILKNSMSNGTRGIRLGGSSDNSIYLNSFVSNSINADSATSVNIWNSSSEIKYAYEDRSYVNYLGNYWDDYIGSDTDGDGIGDTSYPIGTEADNYPLTNPFENYVGGDNFADLGNPVDEAGHNLVGWGSMAGPPENPYVAPSGDTTKRYQILRGDNSVDLWVEQVGIDYTLTTEVEDGICTDNFEIYINGQGPVYSYTGQHLEHAAVAHQVLVPKEYIDDSRVTVTFRNTATDDCGLAAVYNVGLTAANEWVKVNNAAGTYICSHVENRESYRGIPLDFVFEQDLEQGMESVEVRYLQIILNTNPVTRLAIKGDGSPGNEVEYFGSLTRAAVRKFQELYGIINSGEVTSATRIELNKLLRILEHTPLKLVPNGWVLKVIDTHSDSETSGGTVWWEIEDVTDGVRGWVPSDCLVTGNQETLRQRTMLVIRVLENDPVIDPSFRFTLDRQNGDSDSPGEIDIKVLQLILKVEIGHPVYPADLDATGIFGPTTETALKAFQVEFKDTFGDAYILEANGKLDSNTRRTLNAFIEGGRYELVKSRASIALEEYASHRADFSLDGFPLELFLAKAVAETGCVNFDNEIVAETPWGRGIAQIDYDGWVGQGSGIGWYRNGILNTCSGRTGQVCHCDYVPCSGSDCCHCNNCKHYYTNTPQGIEANIKDALNAFNKLWERREGCMATTQCDDPENAGQTLDNVVLYPDNPDLSFNIDCDDCGAYNTIFNSLESQADGTVLTLDQWEYIRAVWAYNGYGNKYLGGYDTHGNLNQGIEYGLRHLSDFFGDTGYSDVVAIQLADCVKMVNANQWLRYKGFSPVELRIYDSQMRCVGIIDGEVQEGIPLVASDPSNKVFLIPFAYDSYHLEVVGTDEGYYGLGISFALDGILNTFSATGIPTAASALHHYTINWDALSQGEAGISIKIDSDGDGEFEETIVTSQPDTPSSPSPAGHATGVDINADLSWVGGDPDAGDTVTYDVYFGTSSTPPFKETIGPYPATQSSITYGLGPLIPGTTYYWQIVSRDNHGITREGPVWGFTIEIIEVQLPLKAGWNMVSVPVTLADNSTHAVFPGVAGVFTWNATSRSYYEPTVIDPEKGYWVAVTENTTISINGTPVDTWTTDINAGWNMIGSMATNSSIADPNDDPDGSVIPPAYWWDPIERKYIETTAIEPGKGYWLASINDCTLTL